MKNKPELKQDSKRNRLEEKIEILKQQLEQTRDAYARLQTTHTALFRQCSQCNKGGNE